MASERFSGFEEGTDLRPQILGLASTICHREFNITLPTDDRTYEPIFAWSSQKAAEAFGLPIILGETFATCTRAGLVVHGTTLILPETDESLSVQQMTAPLTDRFAKYIYERFRGSYTKHDHSLCPPAIRKQSRLKLIAEPTPPC